MKRAIPLLTVMAPAPVVKPKRERLPVEQAIAGGEATNEEKGGPRLLLKIE
jgi:hypothetical protein